MFYTPCEKYWVKLCNMSVKQYNKINKTIGLSINEQYKLKNTLHELQKEKLEKNITNIKNNN